MDILNEECFTPLGYGNPHLLAFLNMDKGTAKDESRSGTKNDLVFNSRTTEKLHSSEPAMFSKAKRRILDFYDQEKFSPSEKNLMAAYIAK